MSQEVRFQSAMLPIESVKLQEGVVNAQSETRVNSCQLSPELFVSRNRKAAAIFSTGKRGFRRFVFQFYQAEKPVGEANGAGIATFLS